MKKIYLIIIALLTCLTLVLNQREVSASNTSDNVIDIYLIAGQSNAVGYTLVDDNAKTELNQMDSRFSTGFDEVLYYGCSNVNVGQNLPNMTVQSTKMGLGLSSTTATNIGPELGMAQYFAASSSNQVGIIKYASGASSLYDDYMSPQNSQRGNWCSPGVLSTLNKKAGDVNITGNCYRVFLDVVKDGLEAYKALGYRPVIKGLAWMQGEAECQSQEYSAKYSSMLSAFIEDVRRELTKIAEQDLSFLHVVVAKIPSYYTPTTPSFSNIVREQQQIVDDNDEFVTTIDNEGFTLPGTDNHHYNWADMLLLGINFAEAFDKKANVTLNTIKFIGNEGGNIVVKSMTAATGSYVENTLIPYRGYELTKDSIKFLDLQGNEVNVKSYNAGNYLQFQVPDTDLIVQIDFKVIPQFSVNTTAENGEVYQTNATRNPYRDEIVSFTFKPDAGYELKNIKVNGIEIDASELINSEQNLIYSVKVSEDIELEANFTLIDVIDDKTDNIDDGNLELKFFNGQVALAIIISSSIAVCAIGLVVFIIIKKKRK